MSKKRDTPCSRRGLQGVTLCISTALVLILLDMVVFSVLTAQNPAHPTKSVAVYPNTNDTR